MPSNGGMSSEVYCRCYVGTNLTNLSQNYIISTLVTEEQGENNMIIFLVRYLKTELLNM